MLVRWNKLKEERKEAKVGVRRGIKAEGRL